MYDFFELSTSDPSQVIEITGVRNEWFNTNNSPTTISFVNNPSYNPQIRMGRYIFSGQEHYLARGNLPSTESVDDIHINPNTRTIEFVSVVSSQILETEWWDEVAIASGSSSRFVTDITFNVTGYWYEDVSVDINVVDKLVAVRPFVGIDVETATFGDWYGEDFRSSDYYCKIEYIGFGHPAIGVVPDLILNYIETDYEPVVILQNRPSLLKPRPTAYIPFWYIIGGTPDEPQCGAIGFGDKFIKDDVNGGWFGIAERGSGEDPWSDDVLLPENFATAILKIYKKASLS
jgi:hypothetical protein